MWLTLLHIAFKLKGQVQAKLFGVKNKNDITSLFTKCLEDKAVGEVPSLSLSLSLTHTHTGSSLDKWLAIFVVHTLGRAI